MWGELQNPVMWPVSGTRIGLDRAKRGLWPHGRLEDGRFAGICSLWNRSASEPGENHWWYDHGEMLNHIFGRSASVSNLFFVAMPKWKAVDSCPFKCFTWNNHRISFLLLHGLLILLHTPMGKTSWIAQDREFLEKSRISNQLHWFALILFKKRGIRFGKFFRTKIQNPTHSKHSKKLLPLWNHRGDVGKDFLRLRNRTSLV